MTDPQIEVARLRWQRDPKIRAEFTTEDSYIQCLKAEERGKIKSCKPAVGLHRYTLDPFTGRVKDHASGEEWNA